MSDPVAPATSPLIAAAAAVSAPPVAAPAPVVADAPPAVSAPAAEAPAAPAAPRVNPWALRPEKPAPVVETPAAATPAATAAPVDPRVADLEARVASLASVLSRQATSELASVPENVRAYVSQIAGTDPAKQLDALHAMRAAGLVSAAPAAVPPGASTMATPTAPAATAQTNPDAAVLAAYERLAGSPIAQGAFASANAAALARARASRPS